MAEFEYVMRQASRMCAMQEMCSDKCPVYVHGNCWASVGSRNGCEIDYAGAEARVLDWAKAHPEPVYPSWEEGWRQLFPDTTMAICPMMFGVRCVEPAATAAVCRRCRDSSIPAEIAKKLGIKPKEK